MSQKRKRDNLPNKPPSIFTHMVSWGAVSGYFLAWGFFILFSRFLVGDLPAVQVIIALFSGFFLFALLGALPGMIMGAVLGGYMRGRLRNYIDLYSWNHDTETDTAQLTLSTRVVIFIVASVLMLLPASFIAQIGFMIDEPWLGWMTLLVPSLIAGSAASYAAQRYLERLRRWKAVHQAQTEKTEHSHASNRLTHDKTQDNGIQYDVIAHTRSNATHSDRFTD